MMVMLSLNKEDEEDRMVLTPSMKNEKKIGWCWSLIEEERWRMKMNRMRKTADGDNVSESDSLGTTLK